MIEDLTYWSKTQALQFDKQNEISKKIDDQVRGELKTVEDRYSLYEKYGSYFKNALIVTAIMKAMTPACPEGIKLAQLDFVKNFGFVKYYILGDDKLILAFPNGERYGVERLDKMFDDNDLKIKLKTNQKDHDCHRGSWNVINHLDQVDDKKIVTGFVKGAAEGAEYLHTWIEFTNNGKEMVADYTINAVMRKDLYYSLKVVEGAKLSVIDEESFNADKQIVKPLIDSKQLQLRQYLYFRDEIMQELMKNKESI